MTVRAATPEQAAAYRAGLCCDCRTKPYSPGRPRCEPCHVVFVRRDPQPPEQLQKDAS